MKYHLFFISLITIVLACGDSTTDTDSNSNQVIESDIDSSNTVVKSGEIDGEKELKVIFKYLELDSQNYYEIEDGLGETIRFDHTDYFEIEGEKKAYSFYAHESDNACHACPGKLTVAVYSKKTGEWLVEKLLKEINESGDYGKPDIPKLVTQWGEIPFFFRTNHYFGFGTNIESRTILDASSLNPVLEYDMIEDGSGSGQEIFASYEVAENFYEQDGKYFLKLKYEGVDVKRKGEKLIEIPRDEEVIYQYLPDKRKFVKQ